MRSVGTVLFWFYPDQTVLSFPEGGLGRLGLGCTRGAAGGLQAAEGFARLWPLQHLQLVRQEMAVCPEQLSEFLDSLRQYLRGTAGARNCFQ